MDLRYPIGHYVFPAEINDAWIKDRVAEIEALPAALGNAILGLSSEQMDTPYRPEGWTLRQVVHHLVDSHSNAYIRLKLALTEETPTIKPYREVFWAETPEIAHLPLAFSLQFLEALHYRMGFLLQRLPYAAFQERSVFHPDSQETMSVAFLTGMYAWHGKHHLAHITGLRERKGW